MERRSLFRILNNDVEAVELDWKRRVTIIKGITHALCYIHHDCFVPIIHHDVNSKNILLNPALEPFVSDFGTARFLHSDTSNQTILAGTYGYIAPGWERPPFASTPNLQGPRQLSSSLLGLYSFSFILLPISLETRLFIAKDRKSSSDTCITRTKKHGQ
ncbi:MDIS1-interacting receptor like kinase 2-like [Ziziphus jujuba]|uniref:non-specific serine/threonine protein kinase n=1 Tax=Ziziphus jujuba TaxID=326968 RepID=A0ABM3IET8_ZIZJJ|nr:MDIS1-interacting receptor like kinase 2-like [Ziziphus jujuba]